MDAGTLHQAIVDAGCPALSAKVGKPDDRATWSFVPEPSNTTAQNDIGNNVIATIPMYPPTPVSAADFIARWTNAEYLALEKKRRDDFVANKVGNAKNWDIMIGDTMIDFTKKKVKTVKDAMVADGILTQARADEIFG